MKRMQTQGIRAREVEGKTYLDFPHLDGERSFLYPAFGPDYYGVVAKEINEAGLEFPTMSEVASLVHTAWQNPKEKYSADIIRKIISNWIRASNGILYVPKEGAYIDDKPKILRNFVSMNKSDLVKRLELGDSSVRFVPFGFKTREQSSRALAKNQFVIALAGEEGAEKLAEVADKYNRIPHVWSFYDVDSRTTQVVGLGSTWGFGHRLGFGGPDSGDNYYGCVFGVLPQTAEGSRKKLK